VVIQARAIRRTSTPASSAGTTRSWEGVEHAVHFYEDEESLAARVAAFLADGLAAGEPALVIASATRRQVFDRHLESSAIDVAGQYTSGKLSFRDADEMLATFMRRGEPDRDRFYAVVGELLGERAGGSAGTPVRVYGEMVDLLWQRGERTAALGLEELWNEVRGRSPFTLLCAYAMASFYKEPAALHRVCSQHSHVAEPGVPQFGEEGRVEGYVGVVTDITERKSFERFRAEAAARTERLVKITAAVADAVTAAEVFEAVVDHVAAALGASSAALFLVDDGARTVRLARSIGYSPATVRNFERLSLDATPSIPALDALVRNQPLWIPSRSHLLRDYPHLAAAVTPGRAYRAACLPLGSLGRTLGVLAITIDAEGETTEDERGFLLLVARYAGQALERLRLLEGERRSRIEAAASAGRAEQLYRFAQSAVTAPDIAAVYEAALDAIEGALGTDRAAILLYDDDGVMRFRAWRHLSDVYRRTVDGHSPWPRDAELPRPILVEDVEKDPALHAFLPLFKQERIASVAFVPLVTRGALIGKFMVYHAIPHAYSTLEVDLASTLANHLASVIDRFAAMAKLQEIIRHNELFAGALAHDLRNPLGAILASADLLQLKLAGNVDHTTKPIGRILASGARMARMIDQLLDFARARAGGGIAVSPRDTDLTDLCVQAIGELETLYPDWRIEREIVGDTKGYWDPDRLLQIASNLVANAGQHGSVEHGVRVLLNGADADAVILQIHNHGSIPASLLPSLFDPFRSKRTRREQSQGLGLGLFIVRELARSHRGSVDVRSSEEEGTTFTVRLPRRALPPRASLSGIESPSR
jgi:signal transduction histidine kinase/PAS domain-containing protein